MAPEWESMAIDLGMGIEGGQYYNNAPIPYAMHQESVLPPLSAPPSFDPYNIPHEDAAELEWLSKLVDDDVVLPYQPTNTTAEQSAGRGGRSKRWRAGGPSWSTSSHHNQGCGFENGVRRCTHCASEKTPQWRTGPLGPKTLCNACGVRYKSGRLVPEYRPAASPTFVLTQHSNSHRKVMELRRQKELVLMNNAASTSSSAAVGRTEMMFTDYGVC